MEGLIQVLNTVSGISRPIDSRAMLRVTPASASCASVWPHCEVSTGRLHRLSTPPRLAARRNTFRQSKKRSARPVPAEVGAHHAAEAGHLLLRQRVVGMRSSPG